MALTTLANVAWALFFINSGIFQPTLVIGSTVGYRFNQTVSLDVPLPVEPSEGLLWQDLSVTTPDSTHLLHPSSGFVANGQVCGILGPSGAGKTTFLSSIAGRPESSLQMHGNVLHYATENIHAQQQIISTKCAPVQTTEVAWLQQHDVFFERLTVEETLNFVAFLELPHLSRPERQNVAKSCLDSLGLSSVQSRQVGSAKAIQATDGASLSGGERRRLSVAVELVSMPNLLVADEPTSGIDSTMSENVMSAIATLVRQRQIPCFCTLHQPRSSIWHMLDSVILMAPGGRVVYIGHREDALPYFASLGFACPAETNPAEFLVDLVSIDPENATQALIDEDRIQLLAYAFSRYMKERSTVRARAQRVCSISESVYKIDRRKIDASQHPFRPIRRLGALFLRSWRQNSRSTALNIFRLGTSMGTALLLSQIFPSVSKGIAQPKSVVDRVALLSFGVINMMMAAVMKTVDVFAKEKPVIQREQTRKLYLNLEYLFGKIVAEIPLDTAFAVLFTTTLKATTGLSIKCRDITCIFSLMTVAGASLGFLIGSITPSQEAAMSTGVPILIILMIVGVVNPSGVDPSIKTPRLIRWVKSVSPIASAIEALAVAEFRGMQFERRKSFLGWRKLRDIFRVGGVALVSNGDEVLDALALKDKKYLDIMRHMGKLSAINFGFSWLFLHFSTSRVLRKKWYHKPKDNDDKEILESLYSRDRQHMKGIYNAKPTHVAIKI